MQSVPLTCPLRTLPFTSVPTPKNTTLAPRDPLAYGNVNPLNGSTDTVKIPFPSFLAADFKVGNTTLYQMLLTGKPVILFFYPQQGSPFCTKQVADIQKKFGGNEAVQLVGVGYSSPKPGTEPTLGMSLLVDSTGRLQKQYGVGLGLMKGLGYSERVTFVIDPKTRLAYRVASDIGFKHASSKHTDNALKVLQALKTIQ